MIDDTRPISQANAHICGVYAITNTVNGKRYVGSSKNIAARFRQHKMQLRRGDHHAIILQRSWAKYGEQAFCFSILRECHADHRLIAEQHYMDEGSALNSNPKARNAEGFRHSENSRKRRSEMMKERFRNDESLAEILMSRTRGVPKTDKFKAAMSARQLGVSKPESQVKKMAMARAALSEEQVLEVISQRKAGKSLREISIMCNVSWAQAQRICRGDRYAWVAADSSREQLVGIKAYRSGELATKYNPNKYRFHHAEYGERHCTQLDLKSEFKSLPPKGISALCTGRKKSCLGWRIEATP